MTDINLKLIEAAQNLMALDAKPHTSIDGVFLTELLDAAKEAHQGQMGVPPIVLYGFHDYIVTQGPLMKAIGEVAYFHRETVLGEQVSFIRDLVWQMAVSDNAIWRIDEGLYRGSTGVHDMRITAASKRLALVYLMMSLGHYCYLLENTPCPTGAMVPLPSPDWPMPIPMGEVRH